MTPDVRFKFNPQVNTLKSLSHIRPCFIYRPENPNLKMHTSRLGLSATKSIVPRIKIRGVCFRPNLKDRIKDQ